ncbi:MAG: TRAP transporter small permease [Roseibium sp.]|uniref:TRAP transporter small permease n=1 Tax=Roseibium sp. TaxID=1936156 RepID=UPI001B265CF1|nr:TRAP transporter small permease [Roseibium sp.]MBO6508213.1 TRAP transporter small permease [Roseibium sp.]MBO6892022.1 TRAP transporter small permease [Roseibium sp.]MBO6929305.1 TRAP transporter small permease [Roseibium sp.]
METFEKLFVAANRALVAGVLALVFGIVFINVLGRYGFGSSFAWVEEAARHLMVLGAFCGAGLALREGRLVAITLLADMLPPRLSLALKWLIVVVMAGFMGVMTWLGIEFVAFGWPKETMSTGMPRGLPYVAIPLGCGLFLVHLALFARRFVANDFVTDGSQPEDSRESQA